MGVKVRRVVMQSVSEPDGIAWMKFLGEFPHDFLQAGMQNLVGIDPNGHQRVVLFFRHREDQPMRDDRAFRLRGKFTFAFQQHQRSIIFNEFRSAGLAGVILLMAHGCAANPSVSRSVDRIWRAKLQRHRQGAPDAGWIGYIGYEGLGSN
jgi:hypothetical protein